MVAGGGGALAVVNHHFSVRQYHWLRMDLHPGDFVSLLTDPGITKGVLADGYFARVQWITRPFMEGRVTTHREDDLYKLAYRVSPSPDRDQERNDEVRPSGNRG